jgi:hypothetical protein
MGISSRAPIVPCFKFRLSSLTMAQMNILHKQQYSLNDIQKKKKRKPKCYVAMMIYDALNIDPE